MAEQRYLQIFVDQAATINDAVLSHLLPRWLWESQPHFLQTWLRNYLTSIIFYFVPCTLWCLYIYYWKRNVYVPEDAIPSREAVTKQIYQSMKALPWLTASVTVSENLIENGWTRCFSSIQEVGPILYALYFAIYLVLLEFFIYWTHRSVHEIKPLYKNFHVVHHKFNKQNTLSPFAGLVLHPVDGVLNSLPYVLLPCIVPVHYSSHMVLMFIDGVWRLNIHDCIDGKVWPAMGAGYHTIHHTTYKHNYGHFTIWMDWMFGTLRRPNEGDHRVVNAKMVKAN